MTDQPQDDHKMNVRLARLCGMKVLDPVGHHEIYPEPENFPHVVDTGFPPVQLYEDYALSPAGDDIDMRYEDWNPLDDERQAFRFVAAALGRMGCFLLLRVVPNVAAASGGTCVVEVMPSVKLGRIDPGPLAATATAFESIARPICLAALEAWEKLEKTNGS